MLAIFHSSPFFSILADECENISTQEELSICCRWLVNGLPEEHFLTILHLVSCDAVSIAEAIEDFISSRNLDYRKLVGKGYDGAAVFRGEKLVFMSELAHTLLMPCIYPLFLPQATARKHTSRGECA